MIGVIDYGMGNIGSIVNMIKRLRGNCVVVSDKQQLGQCDKIILPGVGSFDTAIDNLRQSGLWDPINEFALIRKQPVLGICLGMQIMMKGSEEGRKGGLGWFDAEVKHLHHLGSANSLGLRVPHMGWNVVVPAEHTAEMPLFKNWERDMRFYFVHSYAVPSDAGKFVKGITSYGCDFASVVSTGNIFGFQCHPEKSHRFGFRVYQNFIELK